MSPATLNAVLLLVVFLVAALAGTVTGILRFQEHRTRPDAFLYAGAAFLAVATLTLSALQAVHAFA